jgi:hypothetical protein
VLIVHNYLIPNINPKKNHSSIHPIALINTQIIKYFLLPPLNYHNSTKSQTKINYYLFVIKLQYQIGKNKKNSNNNTKKYEKPLK